MLLIILPVVGLLTRVDADVSQLVAANNEFAWRLYDRLTYGPSAGNVFFCPLSIFSNLAITMVGAGGDTRRQIIEALRYGDSNDTHESFQDLMQVCKTKGPVYTSDLCLNWSCNIVSHYTAQLNYVCV